MKFPSSTMPAQLLLGLLLVTVLCVAQGVRPLPPGMRHAQELEAQNETAPAANSPRSVDVQALRREADQLADLAASVPPGMRDVSKGLLPKDLIQKLKQIEKLSKHLRSELDR